MFDVEDPLLLNSHENLSNIPSAVNPACLPTKTVYVLNRSTPQTPGIGISVVQPDVSQTTLFDFEVGCKK